MCRKYLSESIKALCESGEIKKEQKNGRTLFTVVNYADYQGSDRQKQNDDSVNGNGIGSTDF